MKVKSLIFKDYLRQSCMAGSAAVGECFLDFKDEGVELLTVTAANNVMVNSFLLKKNFEEYEVFGKIGIDNLSNLMKLLERIESEHIAVEKKDNNLLCFKGGNKKIEFLLKDPEYIEAPPTVPNDLSHDISIKLNPDQIREFLNDVSALSADEILFTTESGKLLLVALGQHKIRNKIDVDIDGELNAKFTSLLVDAIGNLTGNIKVDLKNDYPVLFSTDLNANGFIKILVAPKA